MAKKPVQKKPTQKPKKTLKQIIRKMILEESAITKEPDIPKMDFFFAVQSIKNVPKSPNFNIFKLNKATFIEMGSKIQIHPNHLKILNADPKKKKKIFTEIKRVSLIKNVLFIFQPESFVLFDRIYLESNKTISMNQFRKTFRNVLNTVFYALDLFVNIDSSVITDIGDIVRGDSSLYS